MLFLLSAAVQTEQKAGASGASVVSVACSNSHCENFPTAVPANIADLRNIEVLNFFNNQIEELPTQISSLQKLKHLNLGCVY